MEKVITVEVKNVYGNEMIYPVCATSILLAKLAGKKTLGYGEINTIKALGYTIEHKQPTFKF